MILDGMRPNYNSDDWQTPSHVGHDHDVANMFFKFVCVYVLNIILGVTQGRVRARKLFGIQCLDAAHHFFTVDATLALSFFLS